MRTLAKYAYLDSEFGVPQELAHAGSALENLYVYDDAARHLKAMAARGLVEIVSEHIVEHAEDRLIDRLVFKRVR